MTLKCDALLWSKLPNSINLLKLASPGTATTVKCLLEMKTSVII